MRPLSIKPQTSHDWLLNEAANEPSHTSWPLRHFQTLLMFSTRDPFPQTTQSLKLHSCLFLQKGVPSASSNHNPSLTSDAVFMHVWSWHVDKDVWTRTNYILFCSSELSVWYGSWYIVRRDISTLHSEQLWSATPCSAWCSAVLLAHSGEAKECGFSPLETGPK